MKVIATIVVVVLIGMGVATYLVTRPASNELDAQGRRWVDRYETWSEKTQRQVNRAIAGMDFSTAAKNARLIEPLRRCSASFARIGEPPGFLEPVREFVVVACGEAEFAVQINTVTALPTSPRATFICAKPKAICSLRGKSSPPSSAVEIPAARRSAAASPREIVQGSRD